MNDDESTAYQLFHEFVIESSRAIYEENQLDEYLTPGEEAKVAKWKKRTPQATKATSHFFGGDEIEDIYRPLVDLDGKSEVHAAIEQDIGIPISSDDYKKGMVKDKDGKQIRIGSAISDPKLRNAFKVDPLRMEQPTKAASRNVRITRSPTGVAGQTSHGQSWEGHSCKNFNDGSNRHYLCHEVEHGTVVAYLTDKESGEEIARGTFQPYTNKEGNYMYKLDSYYGENNAQFKKYLKQLEKELSQPHSGSPVYSIHPDVYSDSGVEKSLSYDANYEDYKNALEQGELELYNVPEELRTPELCKIAVSKNGKALEYVPEELKTPEICKIAVSQNGMVLEHVPEELRTPEIYKIAVSNYGNALYYVPKELPEYLEICKLAVSHNGVALEWVPEKLRTPEICKIAVSQDGNALNFVPERPKQMRTPELCKLAVSQNGFALAYVPEELRTPELCKIAVSNYGRALYYVPKELPEYLEICKIAVSQNRVALGHVPEELQDEVKRAVEQENQQQ
jgi:hypothetical protein